VSGGSFAQKGSPSPGIMPSRGKPESEWKILVVEDSPSARKLMQELLLRLGVTLPNLRLAASAAESVQYVAQWRPDLVILDVELRPPADGTPVPAAPPGVSAMNGAELALHFLSRNPSLKVVICSASDPSDPRLRELVQKGTVEFIVKPVLAAKVQEVLARMNGGAAGASPRR
jgi:CheY-like chemotaxis protein